MARVLVFVGVCLLTSAALAIATSFMATQRSHAGFYRDVGGWLARVGVASGVMGLVILSVGRMFTG